MRQKGVNVSGQQIWIFVWCPAPWLQHVCFIVMCRLGKVESLKLNESQKKQKKQTNFNRQNNIWWERWRMIPKSIKKSETLMLEKTRRTESSVVPMVQKKSCLCSKCVCVCVCVESPRALRPKCSHRGTYYPPETWHTTRAWGRRGEVGEVEPTFDWVFFFSSIFCDHVCFRAFVFST